MMLKSARTLVLALAGVGLLVASADAQTVRKPVPRPKISQPIAPADTKTPTAPAGPVVQFTHGRVYVMRGWVNIFSRGMDQLTEKLKAQGVQAVVFNHSHWRRVADGIVAEYKADKNIAPIILVGHSLGADASLVTANFLTLNEVPVRLVVTFDGVIAEGIPLNGNIAEVINFYKPKEYGRKVTGGPKFTGKLENIDLTTRSDIDHLNIDKIETLQDEVVVKVLAILKSGKKPKVAAKG